MNSSPASDTSYRTETYSSETTSSRHRQLSWGAILAGTVAALALQIVLMMLGAGLGLAMYNPITAENPVAELGTGAAVIQGLAAVLSLWLGGWVAGRFTGPRGRRIGALHGFMVWCVATVAAILALSTGAGWALGDLSKIVGGGLSMAGKPLAAAVDGAAGMGKDALDRNTGMLSSFTEEGLGHKPSGQSPAAAIRAKREISFAVTRLFTATDPAKLAENKQALVTVLADSQGVSQAEAQKMVDEWSASYEKLKTDLADAKEALAQRAREAAEKTATTLSILSLCSFAAFVFGAIFATLGGKHGGACADKRSESVAPAAGYPVTGHPAGGYPTE